MHARTPGSPARQGCRASRLSSVKVVERHGCRASRPSSVQVVERQGCRDHAGSHPVRSPRLPQHACLLAIAHHPHPARPAAVPGLSSSLFSTPACSHARRQSPRWQSPSPATRRPCVDVSFDGLNKIYILNILPFHTKNTTVRRASPRRRTRRIRCEGVLFHPGALNPRHGASARAQPVRPFREAFVCMSVCLYVGVSVCRCVRMSVCFGAPVGSVVCARCLYTLSVHVVCCLLYTSPSPRD